MSKQAYLARDASEMWLLLRTAKCLERYDQISHQLLSELLVAMAINGQVIGGNNLGSDVLSEEFGLVEVKSRILGTDGPFPRVSLKQRNLDKAAWFAAVRWTRNFELYDAIMLPKVAASRLYEHKKQGRGLAHIRWSDWAAEPSAFRIKDKCLSAFNDRS